MLKLYPFTRSIQGAVFDIDSDTIEDDSYTIAELFERYLRTGEEMPQRLNSVQDENLDNPLGYDDDLSMLETLYQINDKPKYNYEDIRQDNKSTSDPTRSDGDTEKES